LTKFEVDKAAGAKKGEIERALQPHKNTLIESRRLQNNPTAANSLPTDSEENLQNLRHTQQNRTYSIFTNKMTKDSRKSIMSERAKSKLDIAHDQTITENAYIA